VGGWAIPSAAAAVIINIVVFGEMMGKKTQNDAEPHK